MPELPEVETIVRDLREIIVGLRVEKVDIKLDKLVRTGPRKLTSSLKGETVQDVNRRGKHIVIQFSGGNCLIVHLKMTGQFLWGARNDDEPDHVHAVFYFMNKSVLLYRDIRKFGYFLGFNDAEYLDWRRNAAIGPDPFELNAVVFSKILGARKGRIKPLLLNQAVMSGLGNIYVDEALFASKIHPLTPANRIPEARLKTLYEHIIDILEEAIELRGSTTANYVGLRGVGGSFQNRHKIYGKDGTRCRICGETVERSVVGGRGTHFCPGCQALCTET